MELNSFEIGLVVDYYENEIARLQRRSDAIRYTADEYDQDLRAMQIDRIRIRQHKLRRRIQELQNSEGEID